MLHNAECAVIAVEADKLPDVTIVCVCVCLWSALSVRPDLDLYVCSSRKHDADQYWICIETEQRIDERNGVQFLSSHNCDTHTHTHTHTCHADFTHHHLNLDHL